MIEFQAAKKRQGWKNVGWGAAWCVGGTIATLANIGFIFWGAIIFGFIQMIGGFVQVAKNSSDDVE